MATVTDDVGNTASNANVTLIGSKLLAGLSTQRWFGSFLQAVNTLVAGVGTAVSYAGDNVTVDLAVGTAEVNGSTVGDTLVGGFAGANVSGNSDTLIGGSGFVALSADGNTDVLIAGPGGGDLTVNGTDDVIFGNANGNLLENFGQATIAIYAIDNVTVDLATHTASLSGSNMPGTTCSGSVRWPFLATTTR